MTRLEQAARAPRRGLLTDAAPMVLSRVGLATMGLADIVMLSRHGARDMALAALVEGSMGRALDVGIAGAASALPLIAAANWRDGRAILRRNLLLALALGVALVMLSQAAEPLFRAMGQNAALAHDAAPLAGIHACGALFGLASIAAAVWLEGTGRAMIVCWAVAVANLFNLLGNVWLIDGGLGVPALGATGSALSTMVVRLLLMAGLLILTLRDPSEASGGPATKPPRQLHAAAAAMGMAGALHIFGLTLTMMAGSLGTQSLAVYAACWALNLPVMIVVSGLADALALRGAGEPLLSPWPSLIRLSGYLLLPALALGLSATAVSEFYSHSAALATVLAALLPMSAAVLWCDAASLLMLGALRGRHHFALPAAVHIGTMALAVPLAAWLARGQLAMGVTGMVLAILGTSLARLLAMGLTLALTAPAQPSQPIERQAR